MKKLNFKRFFLKDNHNNLYRIFSVANPKDKKEEFYLKLVFPDIKGITLITGKHNKNGEITEIESLSKGVQEFTYHYRSGVSHFKDSNGKVDSKNNLPTLINNPALHLVRFVIRSLEAFKIHKESDLGENDFLLPIVFDGKPRAFEFSISRISGHWSVVNTQGKDPIHTYKIPLDDTNVFFHIADCLWNRNPIAKSETLFEIFRYDNPTDNFRFKSLENNSSV